MSKAVRSQWVSGLLHPESGHLLCFVSPFSAHSRKGAFWSLQADDIPAQIEFFVLLQTCVGRPCRRVQLRLDLPAPVSLSAYFQAPNYYSNIVITLE
jgi:hypothetical protein